MFEVGQRVRIKDNFYEIKFPTENGVYRTPGYNSFMKKYAGKEAVISRRDRDVFTWYYLTDAGGWIYDERWLEPVEEITIEEDSVLGVFA